MKKGAVSIWVEAIGGVIIVAIFLMILLTGISLVSTAMEDSANNGAFTQFIKAASNAWVQDTHSISPWNIYSGQKRKAYAYVLVTPAAAESIKLNANAWFGLDQTSEYNLESCADLAGDGDLCWCLMKINYNGNNGDLKYNMIYVDAESGISTWNQNRLAPTLGESTNEVITNMKVLNCFGVMKDMNCVFTDNSGTNHPCLIRYNNKILVWISAEHDDILESEVLEMYRHSYDDKYLDLYLRKTEEDATSIKVKACKDSSSTFFYPCNYDGDDCLTTTYTCSDFEPTIPEGGI